MKLELAHGDITAAQVDCIVNAANSALAGGGGVDGAIHRAAGRVMDQQCRALRRLPAYRDGLATGEAVQTSGGNMFAQWVIHTVGPIYAGAAPETVAFQQAQLRNCYLSCLRVADTLGVMSIAFPLISAGAYGWPQRDALLQAITALEAADTTVGTATLVLFDAKTLELAQQLLTD